MKKEELLMLKGMGTQVVSKDSFDSIQGIKVDDNIVINNTGLVFCALCNSPETMPEETNTYLYTDKNEVRIATYKNGLRQEDARIIPAIVDIQVLNDKVIIMTFADNTTEKAILNDVDIFSLEQGISVCIMKKVLSYAFVGNGGSVYNKLVEYGLKSYNKILSAKAKIEAEKMEKDAATKRKADKVKQKKEKIATKKREAEIEIQKEAFLRAMREFNNTSNTVTAE